MSKEHKHPKRFSITDRGAQWIYVLVIGLNVLYILLFYWINQSYGRL